MSLAPLSRAAARASAGVLALVLTAGPAVADPTPTTAPTTTAAPTTATPTTAAPTTAPAAPAAAPSHVRFRGVDVEVPAGWPVVDLERNPGTCLRLDRAAVYLGNPGPEQDCGGRAVGGRRAIWVAVDGRGRGVRTAPTTGDVATALDAAATGTAPTTASAPTSPSAAPASGPSPSTGSVALTEAAPGPVPTRAFNGMAFDTCGAPSLTTMGNWQKSPYRAVGIYVGGVNRACGDGNLNASWVQTVMNAGWGLIPTYVGLQAPCVQQAGLKTITTNATNEGTAAAQDAILQAQRFGLGTGTTIYADIENYASGNATCTDLVLKFVSAWSNELRRQGYLAGVYGNPPSLMTDLSNAYATNRPGFVPPDQLWYAHWNEIQTVNAQSSYSAFKDAYWAGRRIHQYRGDYSETWGGSAITIDANWVQATLPGKPTPVYYAPGTTGPGAWGFSFTGKMRYWRPQPGSGMEGMAYTTNTTTSGSESNGATWRNPLGTGQFGVAAYVPPGLGSGTATYVITHAAGTTTVQRDHSVSGWTYLGSFGQTAGAPLSVHLSDDGGTGTSQPIVADAMRFVDQGVPAAPATVSAAPGSGSADVSWTATTGPAAATSYVVEDTAGTVRATVPASSLRATVTGLTNGRWYQFTVRAVNSAGSSAPSDPSPYVRPLAAGPQAAVSMVRLLDTRWGTTANPRRTALQPGESLKVAVAGVSGSPVPAGATAATVQLTAVSATATGNVAVVGTGTVAPALVFAPGRTVTSSAYVPLDLDGTVTLRNSSEGTVQVILDTQAQVRSSTAPLWATITPSRVLDTRFGTTANPGRRVLPPGGSLKVWLSGVSGSPVPLSSATVGVNFTVLGATGTGYLEVSSGSMSATPAVRFLGGAPAANLLTLRPAADGSVLVRNRSDVNISLVADVQGFAAAGAAERWTPVSPVRIADSRSGTTTNPGTGSLAPGESVTVQVAGALGSPVTAGARAAVLTVTATGATGAGYVTTGSGYAVTFSPGTTSAIAVTRLSASGTVTLTNRSTGSVDLVVDAQGYTAP